MSDSLFFQEPLRSLSPLGALVAAFAQFVKVGLFACKIDHHSASQSLDNLVRELTVEWPEDLGIDGLFQTKNNNVQLRATSVKKYETCMIGIQRIFVAGAVELEALTEDHANDFEFGVLSFSDVRIAVLSTENATEYLQRLTEVVFAFTNFKINARNIDGLKALFGNGGIKWDAGLDFMRLLVPIHDANRDKEDRLASTRRFLVQAFEYVFKNSDAHDGVTSEPLYGLKLEILCAWCSSPLSYDDSFENYNSGGYFLYRKARSGVAGNDDLIDLIVRDFFWIRPGPWEKMSDRVSVNSSIPSGALGYYCSTIDKQVYEICSISRRDGLLMLDAVAHLSGNQTKSLCLYMGELKSGSDSHFSYGSILGTMAGGGQPGSWSVVAMRPKISRQDIHVLNACFETYLTSIVVSNQFLQKPEYDSEIENVYNFVNSLGLCGVYYSEMWAEGAATDSDFWYCVPLSELLDRRDAFHRLFLRTARQEDVLEKYVSRLLKKSKFNSNPFREEIVATMSGDNVLSAFALIEGVAFDLIKSAIIENHTITSTPARNHSEIARRIDADQIAKNEQFNVPNESFLFSILQLADARHLKLIEFEEYLQLCNDWRNQHAETG